MIILKLLAPILVLLITALQIVLEYIWHDKRTKLHRRTRKTLLYILVITAIVTLIIVFGDTISANRLQSQFTSVQDTLNKERFEAAKREDDAKKERATLLSSNQELKDMFDSLLVLAKAMNPTLDDNAAIASLLAELEELIEWSGKQKRAAMVGMVWPGGPSYNDRLVSVFKDLLAHDDQLIRSSAETCLEAIGTSEALKILEDDRIK